MLSEVSHLKSEVSHLHIHALMHVHTLIFHSFSKKKKRLFIVYYIKQSSVYLVNCKLVEIFR